MCDLRKVGGKELSHPFSVDCSFNSSKYKAEDEQCDFSNVILEKRDL